MKITMKYHALVCWRSHDIEELRPGWTAGQCDAFLERNAKEIMEAMTKAGWDVIEGLLPSEEVGQ